MKPRELQSFLQTVIINIREPLFIWGPPGIGKSAIVREVAQKNGLELIDLRATLLDPVDLRGVPVPQQQRKLTIWLRPSFLPRDGAGILFLDELTSAPPAVQAACYQLVLDKRVGEHELPPSWIVVAAGNREGEGVVFKMPPALANRFIHVELEPDLDDWVGWALGAGIEDEVIAFLRFRPELLFKFDPTRFNEKAFPTPRTWEKVSRILTTFKKKNLPPDGMFFEAVRGCVGEGPAAEFCSYCRLWSKIPTFEEILLDPENIRIPDGLDVQYAIATMISRRVTKDNFPVLKRFIERLEEEMQVLVIKQTLQTSEGRYITQTRAFVEWASKHANLIL